MPFTNNGVGLSATRPPAIDKKLIYYGANRINVFFPEEYAILLNIIKTRKFIVDDELNTFKFYLDGRLKAIADLIPNIIKATKQNLNFKIQEERKLK